MYAEADFLVGVLQRSARTLLFWDGQKFLPCSFRIVFLREQTNIPAEQKGPVRFAPEKQKKEHKKNSRMDLLRPAVQHNNTSCHDLSDINHRFVPCQLQSIPDNIGTLLKPPTPYDHTQPTGKRLLTYWTAFFRDPCTEKSFFSIFLAYH
jgi:hypothetical protein